MNRYFEDPAYLWLLLLIPLLAALWFLMRLRQKHKLRKFGDPELVRQLMPDVSRWRAAAKYGLLLGSLTLLIVAFARPHWGSGTKTEKRKGIETIIAMDISNSMLAKDVTPSRLDRSKMMVENLVDKFSNDKIGLIVFAGDAFVQLPMTSDYVSAKMFLSSIDPSMIGTQGTDIATAIDMAIHSFSQDDQVGKAIIVITDGEDHEGGAVEAAADAKSRGMRVYVLGVGSPNGSPIPDPSTGKFMLDETGNTVMSALNEDMCRQIAEAGGGAYIHVENGYAAQEQLNDELDKLSKKEITAEVYNSYDEYFIWFALVALVLLILEVLLLERKNPLLRNVHLFRSRKATMLLVLALLSLNAVAQVDRQYVRRGNRLFRSGQFADAEVQYRKAVEANANNSQAVYNLGNALMAQKKDSAAVEQFQAAARMEKDPQRKYLSFHNIGVICQNRHDLLSRDSF
jgi:Ca-activated chloride channel family protein